MKNLLIENLFSVKDKKVLITGGTSGLGLMMAKGFVDNGAQVVCCSRKPPLSGIGATFVRADITNKEDRNGLLKLVEAYLGRLDILINNAGISPTRDSKEFDKIIATNIKAMIDLSTECIPLLDNKIGTAGYSKIINISSIAGMIPPAIKNYGYTISKAGVVTFTRQFAKEVIDKRILVNAIAPGFFKTPMTRPVLDRFEGKITNAIPIKRLGKIEDIVGTALFLASDASNYIVGETIILDGGKVHAS